MAERKGGEADSYYNQGPRGQSNGQYAPAPPMQYPPNAYQGGPNPGYQQPPPNYGQNFQNPGPPPMAAGDGKQTFDQVFKLGTLLGQDMTHAAAAKGVVPTAMLLRLARRICRASRDGLLSLSPFSNQSDKQ